MFNYLHDKQVLISGQGPITEIARELGFKKTTTIEEVVKNFPSLDYVNMKKRNPICGPVDPSFPQIEGIILLNEPITWETPLQLIVDLLVTNGMPTRLPAAIPYPHIPVLACNMDLLWASEAPIPRYGHGAFLLCLENLYKKVTGKDMAYTALVGKPSEITYYHANRMLIDHAKSIGLDNVDTIYAIGYVPNENILNIQLTQFAINTPVDADYNLFLIFAATISTPTSLAQICMTSICLASNMGKVPNSAAWRSCWVII